MEHKPLSHKRVRSITVSGLLIALSLALSFTPIGYVRIGLVSLTTMHIPAIVGGVIEGPVVGLAVGLVFGLTSLVRAWVSPASPVDYVFRNPLVSVLPRLLIPLVAWGVSRLFAKVLPQKKIAAWVGDGCAGALGSLANTVGVLGMIGLVYGDYFAREMGRAGELVWPILAGIAVGNGLPEAALAALLTFAVVRVLRAAAYKDRL